MVTDGYFYQTLLVPLVTLVYVGIYINTTSTGAPYFLINCVC